MKSRWVSILEKNKVFRWILFLSIPMVVYINQISAQRDVIILGNMLLMVLSALAYRKIFIQMLAGAVVTGLDSFNMLEFHLHMLIFQWVSLFTTAALVLVIIEKYISDRRNLVDLVTSLANTLDTRDTYTAYHSQNVAHYSKAIAEEMRLTKQMCQSIYFGGILHDIGKVGIPEAILNKADRLTDEEFSKIKEHPQIGYQLIKHINMFKSNGIGEMVLYHHERYDGKGYPKGLKAEEIPLAARIMAVADSFDAMTSNRVYRGARATEETLAEIKLNSGSQFDPRVVEAFVRVMEKENQSSAASSSVNAKLELTY